MKFYCDNDGDHWYTTLVLAHHSERNIVEPAYRPSVRIREVEVQTDKAGILALLCGDRGQINDTERVWTLTARGGLRVYTE